MNPHDLFALGVCPGLGERDHHLGGHFFDSAETLIACLQKLGIHRWWSDVWRTTGDLGWNW